MYLTKESVKQHLNIDEYFEGDDELLLIYIQAAEDAVSKYYGKPLSSLLEDGELPYSLKACLLLLIGHMYANREAVSFTQSYEIPLSYKYLLGINNDYSENRF